MTGRQMQNFVTISRRQLFKIEPVPNRRKRPAFAGSKTREIKCEAIAQKLDPNLIAKRIGDSAARVLMAFLVTFNPVFLGCLQRVVADRNTRITRNKFIYRTSIGPLSAGEQ